MNIFWGLISGAVGFFGTVISLITIFVGIDDSKKTKLSPRKMLLLVAFICLFCFGVYFGLSQPRNGSTSMEEMSEPSGSLSTIPPVENNKEVDGESDDKQEGNIIEIQATIITKQLFPGDQLKKEALLVEGITMSGESVVLSDFKFTPNIITEGENEITVTYDDLTYVILFSAHNPQLVRINAKYVGESLQKGNEILPEYFSVIGIYEDGSQIELTDFLVEPSTASVSGDFLVRVFKGEISTEITLHIEDIPQNSLVCSERHSPNDAIFWVNIKKWSNTDDLDINGKRYSGGLKIEMGDTFSFLGSTVGNSLTSQITISDENGIPLIGNFTGVLVADQSMFSSQSSGIISILVNGEEKYSTGRIDSSTTDEFAFDIDVDGADSIIVKVDAEIKNGSFTFGIVDK